MFKNSCFRRPFDKKHSKRSEALLKFAWQHLYHTYWSLWEILSYEKYLLVICKILGLFVHTLTVGYKYSSLNRHNLMQPIQIQLFTKQRKFSQCFSVFFKSRSNFEHLGKHDDHHNWGISEVTDCNRRG